MFIFSAYHYTFLCYYGCLLDCSVGTVTNLPSKLLQFLDHLNGIHGNINFTMVTEIVGHFSFLDTDI
jgi:hypothetical protein